MVLYFYAIQHIKLADAVMLNYASPILVLIFAAIFMGEKLTPARMVFTIVAFVGVGFVVKPGSTRYGHAESLAVLAGFSSAFFAAAAYLSIKVATRSVPSKFIVFTFTIVAMATSVLPMLLNFVHPTPSEWLSLFATGIFGTLAQQSMTNSYAKLPAGIASSLLMVGVLFSATIGWACWQEIPDRWSVLGGMMLTLGLVGAYLSGPRPSAA
jgi:drug/metabolite transporter (DMT)-like permease